MEYEFHEVANIFPMMSETEFSGLVNDIKENGQREPIWIWQGKIIDGRNRYKACQQLSIKPKINEWDGQGSLVDFVLSMNLHRRQLSTREKVECVNRADAIRQKEVDDAARRQKETHLVGKGTQSKSMVVELAPQPLDTGKSTDKLGDMFGVSGRTIREYNRVEKDGTPELKAAMKEDKVSIKKANIIAKLPQEEQNLVLKEELQKKQEPKQKPAKNEPEQTFKPEPHIEAPELQAILEEISSAVAIGISKASTEINKLSELGDLVYLITSCSDSLRKSASRLEALIEIKEMK